MADNPLLELAQTVMIEKYGLDEIDYSLVSFTDGAKAVSIKMSDGYIPVSASFPREFLRYEEMKRWTEAKKEAYIRYLEQEGQSLPDELTDSFHLAMTKVLNNPTDGETTEFQFDFNAGDSATITLGKDGAKVTAGEEHLVDEQEEAAEKFVEKTEGKKSAKKRKLKKNK
jgi:hypothetical protein